MKFFVLIATLLLTTSPGFAESAIAVNARPGMLGMGTMMGTHVIAVTVTGVNADAGVVACNYGNVALKLHFPPEALARIAVGDKLQVMLAFSK
jgi:hypothetical protein